MRIILVQAEIELALRAYVLSQIAVKEGQDISIEFKNTRGDDGTTAEINITSPQVSMGNVQKSTETVKESVSVAPVTRTAPKPSTATPAPAVTDTKPTNTESEPSVEVASTTSAPTETASTEEAFTPPTFLKGATSTETPEEPKSFFAAQAEESGNVASSGKSLFANLPRPVNTKPPAE